ncbi:MAG: hypothetical protein ACOX4Q_02195 [Syntrophomonadales bacterium]
MEGGKDFRIGMAVIALAVTVAICLGGYHLYKEYGIKKPLTEALLQIDGVQKVSIQEEKDSQVIMLTLKNDADLKAVFQNANEIAVQKMSDKPYSIEIDDNPSPDLSSLYDDLELGIHQGIANSSFIWLSEWIDDKTASKETEYRIQVDNRNVYLTLRSKDNHYLTRIIERNTRIENEGRDGTDA